MLEVVNMTSAMRAGSQAGEVEQTSDTIESLRAQLQSALAEKQFALSLFAMSKCELDEARNEVAKTVELLQEAQKEMQAVYKGYMEISAQLERLKKGEFCLYVVPALYECRGEGRSDCGAFKR
jgi:flagellar motility protein MotE (MotC chaperone)